MNAFMFENLMTNYLLRNIAVYKLSVSIVVHSYKHSRLLHKHDKGYLCSL